MTPASISLWLWPSLFPTSDLRLFSPSGRCRAMMRLLTRRPRPSHLPGGKFSRFKTLISPNLDEQGGERGLVIVPGGLVPDRVWDRVRPVTETGDCFGQRQCGALGITEVRSFLPGRHREDPLVGFAGLL